MAYFLNAAGEFLSTRYPDNGPQGWKWILIVIAYAVAVWLISRLLSMIDEPTEEERERYERLLFDDPPGF